MSLDLPPEPINSLRLEIGNKLRIKFIDGTIVLRPACTSFPTPCTYVERFTRLYAGFGETTRGQFRLSMIAVPWKVISAIFRECNPVLDTS